MNQFTIEWKRSAIKELRRLPKDVLARIVEAVEGLRTDPFPVGALKLAGRSRRIVSAKDRIA